MSRVDKKNILVLGATGMLGNTVLRYFIGRRCHRIMGSVRSSSGVNALPAELRRHVVVGVDVEVPDSLPRLFGIVQPDVVINCIGIVKQLSQAKDPLSAITINSLLPHRLASLCAISSARLLHVSTDCVFSGRKGMYGEEDVADAEDLYGRSKFLGEVAYPNSVTLRTSIIGHELESAHGLICWFLGHSGEVRGFKRAIFSGVPTIELARIMHDFVIPTEDLSGVYHVSTHPIDKHSLLELVAQEYGRAGPIVPDDSVVIDRSLDSARFRAATGYVPAGWQELIAQMHRFG